MKTIEITGLPSSGKSFIFNQLIKEFKINKISFSSKRKVIIDFANKEKKLVFIEKLSLLYFRFIEMMKIFKIFIIIKNIFFKELKHETFFNYSSKKTVSKNLYYFFYNHYKKVCYKIFKDYHRENKKFINFYIKSINNIFSDDYKKKNLFMNWFYEECASEYLANKYKDQINFYINDEYFVHRAFIFLLSNKKINNVNISNYLKLCPIPKLLIVIKSSKFIIEKRQNKNHKKKNIFKYKDSYQYNLFNKLIKKIIIIIKKKTKVIILNNNFYKKNKMNSLFSQLVNSVNEN